MKRSPLDRSESPWKEIRGLSIEEIPVKCFRRKVYDGILTALVGQEPDGWHLSISHKHKKPGMKRYPSWDEIAESRYSLLPSELTFAMILPPPEQYVAVHDTTFHLHQIPGEGNGDAHL